MHITRLRLRNFRNFRNAQFWFEKGVNTLIGENGSGKTNTFEAIRLLLDENLSRRAQRLRETDFNRALGSWKGHWIVISLEFDELDPSEGCQIIRHHVGHMDDTQRGTYSLICRPNFKVRERLHELSNDEEGKEELKQVLEDISIDQYESFYTGRSNVDFNNDDVYDKLVGDFERLVFPPPEDDASQIGDKLSYQLYQEVSCTFVKALRNVVEELRHSASSPLLQLLRGAGRKIEIKDSKPIVEHINTLNAEISSLDEICQIKKGVQDSLHDTAGYTYSPNIDIQSALPEEMDRLFQTLCLKVSDPGDGDYSGDIWELSLGGANLIYLSLKLLEYEAKIKSDRIAHFLLIEEPEAHIHTHIQKTLFEREYANTQVIVSTHSTHISAASKVGSVNILGRMVKEAQVFHPSAGLSPKECQRAERYLDAVRSTLLFAKGVMLVEGDAELVLLPTLIRKVLGVSLDELGVSLINMSSAVFVHLAALFSKERINRHCAIISDSDTSIVDLPDDPNNDTPFQSECRTSQESGEQRAGELAKLCNGNPWLQAFLAEHTFEVDVLLAGNEDAAVSVLSDIYTREQHITRSTKLLKSMDVAESGREILRLANKVGKGWFAVLLAEHIHINSNIPEYILKALAFASRATVDEQTLCQMVGHRYRDYEAADERNEELSRALLQGECKSAISLFKQHYADDILVHFLGLVSQ